MLVYSPNALKGAPYTELVSAALPDVASAAELKLMRAVAREFPSVASVRVREVMDNVAALVAKLALAIRAATGVALTTSDWCSLARLRPTGALGSLTRRS